MKTNSLRKLALTIVLGIGLASANADITTGLVAHYPLNGNGFDFSGNGYNGAVHAASPASDRLGNVSGALSFDGNADLVGIPAASINNLTSGTIAAWVKLNDNTDETITAKQRDFENSWALFTVGYIPHTAGGVPGKLYFHPRNNVPTGVASSTSIIPIGVWRHVAVTFSSTSVRIYINGQLDSTKTGNYSVGSNLTTTNSIGGWIAPPNAPHWFNGLIDDVRIYNRALTDADVLELKNWQRILNFVTAGGDSTITEGVSKYFSCTATYTDSATADVSSATTWSVLSPQYGSYFSGNKLTAGDVDQDRVITVRAQYTESGIPREATKTITIKPSLFANLEVVTRYEDCTPFARIDLKVNVVGQNGTPQFQWNFPGNHESSSSGSDAWVKYADKGTHLVSVNVTDGGLSATAWFHVVVNSTLVAGAPIVAPAEDPLAGFMRRADNPTQPVEFNPAWASRKNNGLIIITHGLHSSATETWIANMASAIETTPRILPAQRPNIVILDWEDKANPLKWDQVDNEAFKGFSVNPILWTELNAVIPLKDFIGDLSKIRRNGVEQGVYLADWIAGNIDAGNISGTAPIHFIGHSAGGFVGGECGSILRDKITLVTMLDTPCPKERHFKTYPNPGRVERYISSAFGLAGDEFTSPGDTCAYTALGLAGSLRCSFQSEIKTSNYYYRTNVRNADILDVFSSSRDHSFAYEWYTNTIINSAITDGFYYSPFLGHGFHGSSLQISSLVGGGGQMQFYDLVATQSLGGFSSFGDVVTNASGYQIGEALDSGIVQTLVFPVGVQSINFSYCFTSPGDGDFLSVHLGTNSVLYTGPDVAISRNQQNYLPAQLEVGRLGGQTNQLVFKLVSRGNTNAVLSIKDINMTVDDDVDGDGLLNSVETATGIFVNASNTGTDPLNPDSDGDGTLDGAEITAGTNPNDASSVFKIANVSRDQAGTVSLKWPSATGKLYNVQRSTNLFSTNFITILTNVAATPPTNSATDPATINSPTYLYRIQVKP